MMIPLNYYGTFVFVFLATCFFDHGNSDIIVRLEDADKFINVSFPQNPTDHSFEAFFNCSCSARTECNVVFNAQHKITDVELVGLPNSNRGYYKCKIDGTSNHAVKCSGQNNTLDGQAAQKLNCSSVSVTLPNVTLVWNNSDEGFIFNSYDTCKKYCMAGCFCPETTITTATTALTTATTTEHTITTTATAELIPTKQSTTSTTKGPPTSVSATAESTNDNTNNDPPLGLIIGVVIAVVFIAVVIVVIGFFIWRRKQTENTSKPQRKINGPAGTNGDSKVRSDPQYALTDINSSKSKNDRLTPSECATKTPTRNAAPGYEFAQVVDGNDAHLGDNITSIPFSKQFIDGSSTDYGYCAISDTTDTKENSRAQSNSKPEKKKTGIKSIPRDADHGYSSVQEEDIQTSSDQAASVPSYEFAGKPESRNKDSGYEYAGPEYTYDTPHDNKAAQINKDNSHKTVPGTNGAYSVAENVNNSAVASSDKSKDIYSKLHEDNRKIQNPYNTLLQSNNDDNNSQTTTDSSADQTKDIYNRLHEDNIQLQNPYNTQSQTTEDPTSPKTPLAGSNHSSQTVSQPSRYSFAQPTSNGVSSEKTDDNTTDNNKATTPQNNTYHVLEPNTEEDPQEGKDNGDNVVKKRNNYFELKKQEDSSDSEFKEV